MSDVNEVPKLVAIYKRLFLILVIITAVGIGIAYAKIPLWFAVLIALAVIGIKGKVVLDAFKHLLAGRTVLILVFGLTAAFFATLVLLPYFNHNGYLVGTRDVSMEYQLENKPVGGHGH